MQQEAESKARMSDAGTVLLVELHMKYEAKFDIHSDKGEVVWEHVHYSYMKAVQNGTFCQP